MLSIKNADKYFNRHKRNQVHAIDNTSIELGDNGLVALLGPSGCGKTTLLNVIGGLDKLRRGNIYIDNKKITSKLVSKVDKIRNLNVGYIFQDYKLINNMSVYDNVAIVLRMIGIKDKKEINKRVEYVLDKVGMLRYKKRPASMLSGGERQRVGIARAIVKDPPIILADEPTGNLDSRNSLEIMKILQAISKDRLVVLVTHEVNLAKFYASRIIELQDGKVIKEYENKDVLELDYQLDNTFYLKDFDNQDKIKKYNYNINIYSSDKDKLNIDLVIANGNIYIRSNNSDKIEVIDDDSSIELVNEHYRKPTKEDMDKYSFDFHNIINKDIKKKYSSIFNPVTLVINGFKTVLNYSFLKKILLIGFFLSGMFMMYAVSSIWASLEIKDEDFININKEYFVVKSNKLDVSDYLNYEKEVDYMIPGDSIINLNIPYDDYYQTSELYDTLSGSLSSLSMISDNDIIDGSMASSDNEIVVDKFAIDRMFKNTNNAKMIGIKNYKGMIGRRITVSNMNDFIIVGIVDRGSPSIYVNNTLFINLITNSKDNVGNYIDYSLYKDKIKISKGREPSNDYEVIVNDNNKDVMSLNKEINNKINDKKLKVVGYYSSNDNYDYYFVNNNTIKYNLIKGSNSFVVYSNNRDNTINNFKDKGLNVEDTYTVDRNKYIESTKEHRKSSIISALVVLGISLIEIFLMIRSSFLSRVKEIGIYRAIGIKRLDIYKMFFGEIVSITTVAGIPGIILMAYILERLNSSDLFPSGFISYNIFMVIITMIFIYIFNLIIGLLPVFNTVRKAPASILARHDLD